MQSCETQSQWLHLQNTSTLWKRRWKDCKSQRDRESVCPSNIRSCTLKSYRRDCPNVKWTRKIQMDLPNWMGKSPQGLNPMERTVGNRGKVGVGEVVLPSKGHTNWLSSVKWSALKPNIQVTLYTLNKLCLRMCVDPYIAQAITKRPWIWRRVGESGMWEGFEGGNGGGNVIGCDLKKY